MEKKLALQIKSWTSSCSMTHVISQANINSIISLMIKAGNFALEKQNEIGTELHSTNNCSSHTIDQQVSRIFVDKIKQEFCHDTVLSEEELPHEFCLGKNNTWLIDPIDGTHHYLAKDNQYSLMIGLLHKTQPAYGWVYNPPFSTLYHGGPDFGVWRIDKQNNATKLAVLGTLPEKKVRVIIGRRDRKNHPWINSIQNIDIIEAGSIGYKVSRILEDEADVLVHLAGRLKVWDTAGPVALALAAGLEVGNAENNYLIYPQNSFLHSSAIVIGKSGSLDWFRNNIIPSWTQ